MPNNIAHASTESFEPLPRVCPEKVDPQEKKVGSRWVRVHELRPGDYVGEFQLGCAGFIRARADLDRTAADQIPVRQDRMLRSILSVLAPGDAVEFRFRGGGSQRLEWEICGQTRRVSEAEAADGAANLMPSLITLAGVLSDQYRLQPTSVAAPRRKHSALFRRALRAETLAVLLSKSRPLLGFGERGVIAPDESRLVVPVFQPKKSFAFASLAAVIAGAPSSIGCSVRLTPFPLTKQDKRVLREAADRVAAELSEHRCSQSDSGPSDESLAGCQESLAQWLTSGAGYRIDAEVTSSEPISRALCDLIANEIFPSNSAARDVSLVGPALIPQNTVDLSNIIPTRGTLPILFPDLQTLQRGDVPQIYNRRKPRLPKRGVRIGHIDEANLKMPVFIDRAYRDRHSYVIGATGTGKSSLMGNSIVQDIAAGNGLCLVDPHGDLYHEMLRAIPASRQNDVILFNPCETDAVPGINFLEISSEKARTFESNFAINELVKMLDRLYDLRTTGGPMFETYFRNALMLLMDSRMNGYTIVELPVVFEDREFRDYLKKNCNSPHVVNFWNRQAEKAGGESSLQNIAPYITSKLNLLTQSTLLRPIIGQSRSTIDFCAVMDDRKILLVNLSKGQLGELDMQLLGMIIIGKIFSAAMSRCTVSRAKRVPFHLYVDEFQNFTTDTAASLLSEARKFQLSLTLANQNLAQLKANQGKQDLFDAILGNVGSFILFRLGAPDAEKMQVYTKPHFNYEDLQNLPNYHALARLQTSEGPSIPFVFRTEAPARLPHNGRVREAIRKRQRLYRTPRGLVERMILARQNMELESPLDKLIKLQSQMQATEKHKRNRGT